MGAVSAEPSVGDAPWRARTTMAEPSTTLSASEIDAMAHARSLGRAARTIARPNPAVGAVVINRDGVIVGAGATDTPGGAHAEVAALAEAGSSARGATLVVTLEPCSHHGRTPPCVDAVIAAGITRVVAGVTDPDTRVAGRGFAALRDAGIEVVEGVDTDAISDDLVAYLHHRRTGRPYVIAKMATTLDGRTAAADGSSRWITGVAARADVHRLRAECDVVIVGAGTVRADDPELTVRHTEGRNPHRVVMGQAPPNARIHPCLEWTGTAADLLDYLGAEGYVSVLVEGGATVLAHWHERDLVDRWEVYIAPALVGGDGGRPLLGGTSAPTIADVWRGHTVDVTRLGDDVRLSIVPIRTGSTAHLTTPTPQGDTV